MALLDKMHLAGFERLFDFSQSTLSIFGNSLSGLRKMEYFS